MQININGEMRELDVPANTKAVFALRNDLNCIDVRLGCGEGACGACMVLVDGVPTTTCNMAVDALEGKEVRTLTGIGSRERPHPVQQAFIDHQAGQCGYCLSGIIASAVALYERPSPPEEAQIREAMDRHLCRCGTNYRMLNAIRSALSAKEPA